MPAWPVAITNDGYEQMERYCSGEKCLKGARL
jgi:hypothetical protein